MNICFHPVKDPDAYRDRLLNLLIAASLPDLLTAVASPPLPQSSNTAPAAKTRAP